LEWVPTDRAEFILICRKRFRDDGVIKYKL